MIEEIVMHRSYNLIP